jgi:asparagine synthase (glutamine-hydrolysing)
MCGVTGFWSRLPLRKDEAYPVLERMTAALVHRGPDDGGVQFEEASGVGLGHRRLSILDLSPQGHQPMASVTGRFVISFNGEVYNFAELRAELERAGLAPAFRGRSDTEVMLAAIEAWGLEAALRKFVGMFAFALWDRTERRLHLVRDRLGIKPLYYGHTAQGLCFGSEPKSLVAFPGWSGEVDREALGSFLLRGYVPAPRSIYAAASKVPPGVVVTFTAPSEEGRSEARYWSAAETVVAGIHEPFKGSLAEAEAELDRLLREAVKLRMISDVPLGAFLSGGVDSSTVVALMQAQSQRPVHTFSIANETADYDEAPAAARVAAHLGTKHTALTVTGKDALALIPSLPGVYDEPFADSSQLPMLLVSKLARRDVTVALSGDGGDELFGGYNRHFWGPALWYVQAATPGFLRAAASRALTDRPPVFWDSVYGKLRGVLPQMRLAGARAHKLGRMLEARSYDDLYRKLTTQWAVAPLLGAPPDWDRKLFWTEPPLDGLAHQFMYRDTVSYLPDDILAKVDRATMSVGLEAREPLLDHRVLAFAWSLPLRWKVRPGRGKHILRQVLGRYVPESLIEGPKMGFGVPLGDWLRGPLREWAESLLSEACLAQDGELDPAPIRAAWEVHLSGERPGEHMLWNVLMYQAWKQAQVVGQGTVPASSVRRASA